MAEDIVIKREILLEADAETLEKMRKEGHARGFTVHCDEGERVGGENTAPPPPGLFWISAGLLTTHPNFPVRGNDEDKD